MRKSILARSLYSFLGAMILVALIAAPALASPAAATRTLPASAASGAEFDIGIEASGCGYFGQVVETLPDGFSYFSCYSGDIEVEQIGNTVKFSFMGDSASFTYRVRAPIVDTPTAYTLGGMVLDQDRVSYPMAYGAIQVIPAITWNLPWGLDADPSAVNIWTYPEDGSQVTLAEAEWSMPEGLLLWNYGGPIDGWCFYKKGWGEVNTLTTLVPGEGYIGIVPETGQWNIPQQ
jgi:hypothetical protein